MMRRALIGHTGFVGGNLDLPGAFTHRYNSKNFRDIEGESFDEVVCAGVQAVKWWANQNAEADWSAVSALLAALEKVKAGRFSLISTVDVYADPQGADEGTPVGEAGMQPYGLHRLRVENRVRELFPVHCFFRLPGLFGKGIKKNLIFDLLTGRDRSGFHPGSEFQFYPLARLAADMDRAAAAGLSVLNLAVEPVSVAEVTALLGETVPPEADAAARFRYDMQTRHAILWGQGGRYLIGKTESLAGIAAFAQHWREEQPR